MDEMVVCPRCQAQLVLPSLSAGQTVRCPRCERVFELFRQRAHRSAPVIAPRNDVDNRNDEPLDDPQPLFHPDPLRGEWKAIFSMILLGACMISFGVQSYVNVIETERIKMGWSRPLGRILPGGHREEQELRGLVARTYVVHGAILCISAVFLLLWLWQASRNLTLLQATGISHLPIGAVVSFFIPVMNLYRPYAITQEIWRASDPHAVANSRDWIGTPSTSWIRFWWLFSIMGALPLMLSMLWDDANTIPNIWGDQLVREWQLTIAWILCMANLCMIAAGGLLTVIIRSITRRQRQRYRRLYEDPA